MHTTRPTTRARRRLGIVAAIVATASMALTACASDGSAPGTDADPADLNITFIPKQLNNPYTDVVLGGGEEGATAAGFGATEIVGPLEASASSQVPFINAETQAGTNVLAIAANDPDAVCSSLEEARTAGAKIVAFDSDTNCRDIFVSQVDAKEVALTQLELIAEQIGGSGKIAILSATANATNQNEWISFMEEELENNEEYAGIELVAKVYGDDDDTKSFQEAQGLMQSYPDLAGIVSPTTVGIAATARYLSTSEYKGQVALTGLGLPNEMRPFVEDGTVTEFALWDPAELGYVTAYAGLALSDGTITGEAGDTFTAGDLGERTVEENGVVVVGPPTVFNAENIDEYDF